MLVRNSMFVQFMGVPPSDGDVAVSLCLFVRFGMAVIFTFSLVSCLGCLGDVVIRPISGLMVLLTVHRPRRQAHKSRFRRAELWLKNGGRHAHGKLPRCQERQDFQVFYVPSHASVLFGVLTSKSIKRGLMGNHISKGTQQPEISVWLISIVSVSRSS